MNCKPGDLAMVVDGIQENIGKTVRVIRQERPPYPTSEVDVWLLDTDIVWRGWRARTLSVWRVDFTVRRNRYFKQPYCPDSVLMPIRPPGNETEIRVHTVIPTFNPANIKVTLL